MFEQPVYEGFFTIQLEAMPVFGRIIRPGRVKDKIKNRMQASEPSFLPFAH